jgi:hypothetical protein
LVLVQQSAVDVVDIAHMTRQRFVSLYENRRPVIVRGIVSQWPASSVWPSWGNGPAYSDVRLLQSVAWDLQGARGFGSQSTRAPTDNTSLVALSQPSCSQNSSAGSIGGTGLRLSDMFASPAHWAALGTLHGHSNRSAAVLIDGRVLDNNPRLSNDCKSTAQCPALRHVFGVNILQALQQVC